MKNPNIKLICLTPVRNEAWILKAFLTATSLWADYIIIADQGSTDGSREIALSFSKVILLDNPAKEMHQAQARKLLFDKAAEIKGEKILFALDADEFLSGNFTHTSGWTRIINSKIGEAFCFRWLTLSENPKYYDPLINSWMFWALHIDDTRYDAIYPDNYIHEWRLPYPKNPISEIFVEDIYFIHFAHINKLRQANKILFYQVITKYNEPQKSAISLFRMYNNQSHSLLPTDQSIFDFYTINGIDVFSLLDYNDEGKYFKKQILKYIKEKGSVYFKSLDIWHDSLFKDIHISDPRDYTIKFLHAYLRYTKNISECKIIKSIDFILKKLHI